MIIWPRFSLTANVDILTCKKESLGYEARAGLNSLYATIGWVADDFRSASDRLCSGLFVLSRQRCSALADKGANQTTIIQSPYSLAYRAGRKVYTSSEITTHPILPLASSIKASWKQVVPGPDQTMGGPTRSMTYTQSKNLSSCAGTKSVLCGTG